MYADNLGKIYNNRNAHHPDSSIVAFECTCPSPSSFTIALTYTRANVDSTNSTVFGLYYYCNKIGINILRSRGAGPALSPVSNNLGKGEKR